MKIIWLTSLVLAALFGGCRREIVPPGNVESLELRRLKGPPGDSVIVLREPAKIKSILRSLNDAEREPVQFLSTFRLDILYPGHSSSVLICGRYFKVDGISYQSRVDVEALLRHITGETIRH